MILMSRRGTPTVGAQRRREEHDTDVASRHSDRRCAAPKGGAMTIKGNVKCAALAAALASFAASSSAAAKQAVPEIQFDANVNYLKFPETLPWGEVAGVALDARRHLFAYVRTGAINALHEQVAASLYEFGP